MPGVVNGKRSYVSPLRADRARATRWAVLSAASELFARQGYAATSITAIAARAGVSPDTVYQRFGTKSALLKQVLDETIGGDDQDVPFLQRTAPQRLRDESDQHRQITMFANGIADRLERIRPMDDVLRSAAAVDPEIAALRADIQLRQRREAMLTIAGWIAARGPLALEVEEAGAVLWTSTSPEVHRMFRVDWAWTRAQYEWWLRVTLEANLMPNAGSDSHPG